jgi:hypothetical protein
VRTLLAAIWLVLCCSFAVAADRGEAALDIEVPAAQWKGVRLKNLPKGTSVALQIEASGKIRVLVVAGAELKRFPRTRALFEATVDSRMGFSVIIPRSGDYYVVFDNRAATEARRVQMKVQAVAPQRRDRAPADKPALDET